MKMNEAVRNVGCQPHPPASYAGWRGRAAPRSTWHRGAPEGVTAPRWGRVKRCGEAWALGAPGDALLSARVKCRLEFLSALQSDVHYILLLNLCAYVHDHGRVRDLLHHDDRRAIHGVHGAYNHDPLRHDLSIPFGVPILSGDPYHSTPNFFGRRLVHVHAHEQVMYAHVPLLSNASLLSHTDDSVHTDANIHR